MDGLKLYTINKKSIQLLIQILRMFSNDIGMKFGVEICAVFTMKQGKIANSDRMALPIKTTMKGLKEGDSYKYLGVVQAHGTKHHEIKKKLQAS